MAKILSIESATTMCSIAMGIDGEVSAIMEVNEGYSHAEQLAPFVQEILLKSAVNLNDLDAIAVSKGPGSYTGLRIGVSLAKGLCYASGKPLVAVDSLQQMCLHPNVIKALDYLKDPLLCPMLDARRMEVFAGLFDIGLKHVISAQPFVLDELSFQEYLKQDAVLFFGNGSNKFKNIVQNESAYFAEDVWPSAAQMVPLAEMAFEMNDFEDLAYFEPNYVKAFQATTPKSRI